MPNYKPTRTDDNLPSRSTPIRKGKMSKEQIEATAKELTRLQVVEAPKIETDDYNKNHSVVKWFNPSYCTWVKEPVATPWNYKVYAEALKAMIKENDTVEVTADQLSDIFPQARWAWDVARNLSRSYGLSYRRIDNGRNDTYVFFVEPTREELIVQLTSAESKVIELEKEVTELIRDKVNICQENENLKKEIKELQKEYQETYDRWWRCLDEMWEEINQLKSDLFYSKRSNIFTLAFAIWAVITIILKSVA